jgi:CreA protein
MAELAKSETAQLEAERRRAQAADEPDLIFKRSTVFKLLTPNDKLAT